MQEVAVRVEGLAVSYGTFVAVENLSFTVRNGEIYGLLGPNGAGKTTTLKVLVGVLEPRSGRVEIFDTPVSNEIATKSQIGYVPEEVVLFDSLTPREFLEFTASLRHLETSTANPRLEKLTSAFDLTKYLDRKSVV